MGQLIRYVLAEHKVGQPKETVHWSGYVPGKQLTAVDITYLEREIADRKLLAAYEAFAGSLEEFIACQISREKEQNMDSVIFKQNIRARSINGYIREFERNEEFRVHKRSNSNVAYHHIISFSQKDTGHLTEKALQDMVREYISLRGANSLFLGAVHTDKNHVHVHLIQSGVQYMTGLANRISREQFQELKVAMQKYQFEKYPELVHSLPNFKSPVSKEQQRQQAIKNIKTERTKNKDILIQFLSTTLEKSPSKEKFLESVVHAGYEPYFRSGKLQGVRTDDGTKFRFSTLGFSEDIQQLDNIKKTHNMEKITIEKYTREKDEELRVIEENVQEAADDLMETRQLREMQDLRDGTHDQEISGINLYNAYIDRLCNDCKKESADPSYQNPHYFTNGTFDAEKYQAHLSQELSNVIAPEALHASESNEVDASPDWGAFADDADTQAQLQELDDLRNSDRDNEREQEFERDFDNDDLER